MAQHLIPFPAYALLISQTLRDGSLKCILFFLYLTQYHSFFMNKFLVLGPLIIHLIHFHLVIHWYLLKNQQESNFDRTRWIVKPSHQTSYTLECSWVIARQLFAHYFAFHAKVCMFPKQSTVVWDDILENKFQTRGLWESHHGGLSMLVLVLEGSLER